MTGVLSRAECTDKSSKSSLGAIDRLITNVHGSIRHSMDNQGFHLCDIYSISQEICTRFCCALLCCGYAIVHNEFT